MDEVIQDDAVQYFDLNESVTIHICRHAQSTFMVFETIAHAFRSAASSPSRGQSCVAQTRVLQRERKTDAGQRGPGWPAASFASARIETGRGASRERRRGRV